MKAAADNEGVQQIGKAILNGVPALMNVLETMSKAHPFAQLAFQPFKWAYDQEMKRRDNETTSRLSLFESIKNVMLISIEMKDIVASDDQQQDPQGNQIPSRLAEIGGQMKDDIYRCYAALDAMQKQSLFIRFCHAAAWNERLQGFKDSFKNRQDGLMVALSLYTARNVHEIVEPKIVIKGPIVVTTSRDREIEAFYRARGGEEEVFKDDEKCRELLKLQNELTGTHNIQIIRSGGNKQCQSGVDAVDTKNTSQSKENLGDREAISQLRKERKNDVATVIRENMQSFQNYWNLTLNRLSDDINQNTHREVDRMIDRVIGKWPSRIKDEIIRDVWVEQAWHGNAKTRTLTLALCDYLVERVEGTTKSSVNNGGRTLSSTPSGPADDPNLQDSNTAIGFPLPDPWVVDYLGPKRLRYLQQALDPDASGLSTINEVNSFTQSCPPGWSVPRWISYWAVGWQIFSTRYCLEIDRIFTQMMLIRKQVGISMAGNKGYINDYILRTWPLVYTLTSGLERFDGSDWLAAQFQDYIDGEEIKLRSKLRLINYRIDSMEMVNELLGGNRIEHSIFMLLGVIMRHHLNKMHLSLSRELDEAELVDDTNAILYVVDVAWYRYNGLVETYRHQQVADMDRNFEWFSCGLFRKYHEWKDWSNDEYYKSNEVFVHSGGNEITKVKEEELKNTILTTSEAVAPHNSTPTHIQRCRICKMPCNIGTWFGFHCNLKEPEVPRSGMVRINLKVSKATDQTNLTIGGEGTEPGNINLAAVEGLLVPAPGVQELGGAFNFKQMYSNGKYTYRGVFDGKHEIISGTFKSPAGEGSFFLKKTPRADTMCYRPLHVKLTPAELWSFLRNTVLRQKPSSVYLSTRFKMIRRTLELFSSTGKLSLREEDGEFSWLQQQFTVDGWMEILKLGNWYNRVGDLQPNLWCNLCGEVIRRTRVTCMDCQQSGNLTVNFHNPENCITTSRLVRDGLSVPHDRTHTLIKTRDIVLHNDFPTHQRRAKLRATMAASVFPTIPPRGTPTLVSTSAPEESFAPSGPSNQSNDADGPPAIQDSSAGEDTGENDSKPTVMNCFICEKPVSTPCWYCIDCKENEAFICLSCETEIDNLFPWDFQKRYREEMKTPDKHNVFHLLIRFDNSVPTVWSDNAAVPNIEERHLHSVQQGLLARMDEDKAQLEARLAKIEAHLQAIMATLDV
ncbi:hypothetical protein MSAN_00972900 [Mycena sanguinolenta]|uniref:Uncharacterized protein n=1 Tax=Mycena sanguinolenta TaxID=230812 RepID=A0A8H6YY68_9AGAR|nr:hypothetical protein MSAN_00972900 [Mycena sanguinolenta]